MLLHVNSNSFPHHCGYAAVDIPDHDEEVVNTVLKQSCREVCRSTVRVTC